MVVTPVREWVDCEFKYRNYMFLERKAWSKCKITIEKEHNKNRKNEIKIYNILRDLYDIDI